jgi:hypothetical protein
MKQQGKLIKTLPTVSGETERGMWIRGGFVIETFGDYPKKLAFTTFGEERARMAEGIALGTPVEVSCSMESREFNDKWYTELRATSVKPLSSGAVPVAKPAHVPAAPAPTAPAVPYPANFVAVPAPAPEMPKLDDDPPF